MRKILRKIKKRYFILMLALIVFVVSYSVINLNSSYSVDDAGEETEITQLNPMYIANNKTLNPEWLTYLNSSTEEQESYQLIPDKYLEDGIVENNLTVYEKADREYGATVTDSYYNLKNSNRTLPNRNQNTSGLCWAFASLSAVESTMIKEGLHSTSSPVRLAVRQMDYASATGNNLSEGINPYGSAYRTSVYNVGGFAETPYGILASGVSPMVEDGSRWAWNDSTARRSMRDVLDVSNTKYFVSDIAKYGKQSYNQSRNGSDAFIQSIKSHVKDYGEVAIGSIGPSTKYGGNCLYTDSSGITLINEKGNCNPIDPNNGHSMTIIGWDDNYTYKYCRGTSSTSDYYSGCPDVVEGKGAFILKNSWGNSVPNPYLAYSSLIDYAYGIVNVVNRDWDINYDKTKPRKFMKTSSNAYEVTYKKSEMNETIKWVTFEATTANTSYEIWAKNGDGEYTKIKSSFTSPYAGFVGADVSEFNISATSFSVKVVLGSGELRDINVFASYASSNSQVYAETIVPTEIMSSATTFDIYTETRNIPSGVNISYKVFSSGGADITSMFTFGNTYNLNGFVDSTVTVSRNINDSEIKLITYYNNSAYNTDKITIRNKNGLWESGTGISTDPFIIKTAQDFKNIFTDEVYLDSYFKLNNDIDFSGVSYNPTSAVGAFTGHFDGNGHSIYNLSVTASYGTLFAEVFDGTVTDLSINNSTFKSTSGVYAGVIAATSSYSTFSNIVIGDDVSIIGSYDYVGGIVGFGREVELENVANFATIKNNKNVLDTYTGGIVGYSEDSFYENVFNRGNLTVSNGYLGGITGRLEIYGEYEYNELRKIYNRSTLSGGYLTGGLVGYDHGSTINYAYTIDNGSGSGDYYGAITGLVDGVDYFNIYHLSSGDFWARYPENASVNYDNIIKLTSSSAKSKSTYDAFDFSYDWVMRDNYPVLRDINVYFMTSINASDITVNKKQTKTIEYSVTPTNAVFKKVKYTSDKTSVATVDENGKVKGVASGTANITLKSLDDSSVIAKIKVTVTNIQLDFGTLNVDEENSLIRLNPETKVSSVLNQITTSGTIGIKNYKNVTLTNDKLVGTGSVVAITVSGSTVNYTVIVMGDVTGSGKVGTGSLIKLANHDFVGGIINESYFLKAADLNGDNKVSFSDVMKLANSLK